MQGEGEAVLPPALAEVTVAVSQRSGEPVGAPVQGTEGELTWEVTTAWATLGLQNYVKQKSSYCSVSPFDLWGN